VLLAKHNLKKMQVEFYKVSGVRNDFVMIDNRLETFQNHTVVAHLCNKTFGIGGDDVSFIKK
jgi:diaminopimelate epimerase